MTSIFALIGGLIVGLLVGLVIHFIYRERALAAQRGEFDKSMASIQTTFRGLSSEVLKESREEFIRQAEPKISEHIAPLRDALNRYNQAINEIEGRRNAAYGGLQELLKVLQDGQRQLTHETSSLVTALKNPAARGRWGELTLKRVVEISGMSEYCDFDQQVTVDDGEGKQRPDLVVKLAGGRTVVVDAKSPIDAYWTAMEATDEALRISHLVAHAQAVRDHMRSLGQKSYWSQFENAPDFVVLFHPGESFFSAALEQDRDLIEDGMKSKVVLATPTTLIALLRVVALGWQQERLAENSALISDAGKDLFERCKVFSEHFSKVGAGLQKATVSFNDAVRSWETRLMPGARKLKELGATKSPDAELPDIDQVELSPRKLLADDPS